MGRKRRAPVQAPSASHDAAQYAVDRSRAVINAYEAGKASAVDPTWQAPFTSVNAMGDSYLQTVRGRVRHVIENNPMLRGARGAFAKNVTGRTGVFPRPTVRTQATAASGATPRRPGELDEELNSQITDLFFEFAEGCDASRQRSLVEVERAACHEIFSVDEVFSHYPYAPAIRGFPTAPCIELIPTEQLPIDLTGTIDNGRFTLGGTVEPGKAHVRQGVEFNAAGQVTGYHVLVVDPSDTAAGGFGAGVLMGGQQTRRIDASAARLSFTEWQPKQVRGVPSGVAFVTWNRALTGYIEAEMTRATAAACVVGVLEGSPYKFGTANGESDPTRLTDINGNPVNQLAPGMMLNLPQGAKFTIEGHAIPGPGFDSVNDVFLYAIAAGLEVPYETLTRNYSKTTFSSSRASELSARKSYQAVQLRVWDEVVKPFYRNVIDWGILTGRITLSSAQRARLKAGRAWLYACEVSFPGWEWVNPQQEAQASQMRLESGTTTLADECAAQGRYADEVIPQRLREINQALTEARRLGVPDDVALQIVGIKVAKPPAGAGAGGGAGGAQDGSQGQDAPTDSTTTDSATTDNADPADTADAADTKQKTGPARRSRTG